MTLYDVPTADFEASKNFSHDGLPSLPPEAATMDTTHTASLTYMQAIRTQELYTFLV